MLRAFAISVLVSAASLSGGAASSSSPSCPIPSAGKAAPAIAARQMLVVVNRFRHEHGLRLVELDRAGTKLYVPAGCSGARTLAAWRATPRSLRVLMLGRLKRVRFVVGVASVVPPAVSSPPAPPVPPAPPIAPPVAPPAPPDPPGPPPTIVGVPYVCDGPVSNVRVVGVGTSETALVNLAAGCTGTISFDLTITAPGGGDGVKVQDGAHDIVVGPSSVVCEPGVPASVHQDGVQVQGGTNVTFLGLVVRCESSPGAGAFYIDGKDFPGISGVVCDGCDLWHMVEGALFTAPAPGSGVRNSVIHQGTTTRAYFSIVGSGAVDEGNVLVPRAS